MARAIWSGSVSFGLVNIPIKMYSGVRDHTAHFHQVDKRSGSRIRYEKVAEKTGKEVDTDQIELGYEAEKGKLVVVDPQELEELRPRTTRSIDITDFVELSEIDPVYYNRTYWLVPDGEAATRAYALLARAMEERHRVGVGMAVIRNKQYLAAIRPRDGVLALSTMRFADEVVPVSEIGGRPQKSSKPEAKVLRMAGQIIDSLAGPWQPERYHDTYAEEVRRLIRAHEKGQDVVVEQAPAVRAERVDLMEALEASLRAAKSRGDRNEALEEAAERLTEVARDEDADGADTGQGRSRRSRQSSATKARKRTTKRSPSSRAGRRHGTSSRRSA